MPWLLRIAAWWRRVRRPPTLGQRGERLAVRYLRRQGYVILAQSSRSWLGELDVVAVDGRTVVFVEVKTRRSDQAGHPADAVDPAKQQRLTRLALAYLKRHGLLECSARFDVVAVIWPATAGQPQLAHYRRAFEPADRGQMFS
jgi:putative endonuclease